jgi:hypothetical protein
MELSHQYLVFLRAYVNCFIRLFILELIASYIDPAGYTRLSVRACKTASKQFDVQCKNPTYFLK